ncbi:MAG: hypothetical protein U9O89_03495 [Thermoproteota archaeon]|nr:hypothetical protein [Thermoproteota archaeon]
MTIPSAFVTRFFQLITERKFAEAERQLREVKKRMEENEWNRGYSYALRGILLGRKTNNNQYTFLSNLNPTDEKTLRQHRREFLKHMKKRLHVDYDRGFFSAWADYMYMLIEMNKNAEQEERKAKPIQTTLNV